MKRGIKEVSDNIHIEDHPSKRVKNNEDIAQRNDCEKNVSRESSNDNLTYKASAKSKINWKNVGDRSKTKKKTIKPCENLATKAITNNDVDDDLPQIRVSRTMRKKNDTSNVHLESNDDSIICFHLERS